MEVIQIGGVILKGFGLALPFIGAEFIGVGVFQATGYGKMSLFFAIARKIILAAVSSFVLKHLFAKWENQAA